MIGRCTWPTTSKWPAKIKELVFNKFFAAGLSQVLTLPGGEGLGRQNL